MNDEVEKFIASLGSMGEVAGILKKEFLRNGFTDEEAFELVRSIIVSIFEKGMEGDKK